MKKYDMAAIVATILTLMIAAVLFYVAVSGTGHAAETPSYHYTRLRQELLAEISILKLRIVALESERPPGTISVYTVDSAAGTITCRSCRFVEEKNK